MEDFTTEGEVSILLDVVRPTKQITLLHVHPDILTLTHSGVKVNDMDGGEKRGLKRMQRSSFIQSSCQVVASQIHL